MSDVAREAGVSKPTVWAIMNPEQKTTCGYSEKTRDKVLKVVEKLGYRVNRTAQNFLRHRHGAIGLVLPHLGGIPGTTLTNMLHGAQENGVMLTIEEYLVPSTPEPRLLTEDWVDGIAFFSGTRPELRERADSFGIPCIEVNCNNREGPAVVSFDDENACRIAMERFAELGRKRPAFIKPRNNFHYSIEARENVLAAECQRLGMEPLQVLEFVPSMEHQLLIDFLKDKQPDAVVLYHDMDASVLFPVAHQLGIKMPKEMAVISFDDSLVASAVHPQLSSFGFDTKALGKDVVTALLALIEGKKKPKEVSWQVKFELQERGSTRA